MTKIIEFPKSKRIFRPEVSPNTLNKREREEMLSSIPIVAQALFLLEQAAQEKGIKTTEKGNLNRSFIQAFWQKNINSAESPFKPSQEADCLEATRINFLLTESKYVRKIKGSVVLTRKGEEFLATPSNDDLYVDLMTAALFRWSWDFMDAYPDFSFIQDSAPELIRELYRWPQDKLHTVEFFETVFENDDEDVNTVDLAEDEDDEYAVFNPHSWAMQCFQMRFFRRFCIAFGILENNTDDSLLMNLNTPLQKTDFFKFVFPKIAARAKIFI